MTSQLPPSKFGAGTTYGQAGQSHALPQTSPPPQPVYPSAQDPYAASAYQAPPTPDPHSTVSYPTAATPQYSAPQLSTSASYPGSVTSGSPGSGTAIAAAILSLIGALWYGIDVIRTWDSFQYILTSLDSLSSLGMRGADVVWGYAAVGAAVAQLVLIPLLLLGGILLLTRSSAGRTMAILGSLLVIVANVVWIIAAVRVYTAYASYDLGGSSVGHLIGQSLLNMGLPTLLAVVVLFLAASTGTKQWCSRAASPGTY